jgi:predicted nucleic acid-binding protein
MIIVSDSGPIISFARADYLKLLRQLFQEIIIPEAVYEEIAVVGGGRAGAKEVISGTWIKKRKIGNQLSVKRLPQILGLGEREAIILAQELNALLLIDDRKAREVAEKNGISCFGSLRVLKEAKNRKLISAIKPIIDELRKKGLRIDSSLYQKFLQEVGE